MTRRIFIIRHGNTFEAGEAPRRIGARTDLPLVESGRRQGEALGRWFAEAEVEFGTVLTSPLRRTRETAALILRGQARPPEAEPAGWLAEIDHGPDEDRTDDQIVARIGAEALALWDSDAIVPPDWIADVEARLDAWRALFAEGPTGDTLLVSSNGAARFALMAAPGLIDQARAQGSIKLRTGAWGRIDVDASGRLALGAWDRRPSHIPG